MRVKHMSRETGSARAFGAPTRFQVLAPSALFQRKRLRRFWNVDAACSLGIISNRTWRNMRLFV
jgi:hypothetical protein